jgi:hypothetical protein
MNEQEQERYESELRRTPPAPLPAHFMARLQAAKPGPERGSRRLFLPDHPSLGWRVLLHLVAPAMAVVLAGFLVVRLKVKSEGSAKERPLAATVGLKANDLQVDQELVSSFDVVATLPNGQPVRFRCRQWKDQLVVTDKSRGVEIEQNSPRVEVVPVRFETY